MSIENNENSQSKVNPEILEILILFLGLIFISLTSLYDYLLFHSIAEIFSIVIAGGVFLVGWNSRKYINSWNILSFYLNY